MTFAQACSSKSWRSTRKPASGQKSASVCIFSWLISTASGGSSRPVSASSRARRSSRWQLAQVAAVHPAQLLLVEHGGVASTRATRSKRSISSSVVKKVVVSS